MVEKIKILSKKEVVHNVLTEWLTLIFISLGLVVVTVGVHNVGIPLYKINPMHWVLYFFILQRKPHYSSIILISFLMPLSSAFLTGHPIFIKGFIMTVELIAYGLIFSTILKKSSEYIIIAYLLSQIFGKTIYYSLKYLLIRTVVLDSAILLSSILLQFVISLFMVTTLYFVIRIKKNNRQ